MKSSSMQMIIAVASLLFLSGCASMYIPPSANIPLLEEKNEGQIEVGVSTNSLYLLGNYAITDKLAIMASGNLSFYNFSHRYDLFDGWKSMVLNHYTDFTIDDYDYSHVYGELGLGGYNLVDLPRLKLETFAGGGYGYAATDRSNHQKEMDAKNRYFLVFSQTNIAFRSKLKKENYVEVGGAIRLAYSHFNYSFEPLYWDQEKLSLRYNNIFIEPTALFRIGSQTVRFVFKVGLSIRGTFEKYKEMIINGDDYPGLKNGKPVTTKSHISIGINFRIGGNKKKAEYLTEP